MNYLIVKEIGGKYDISSWIDGVKILVTRIIFESGARSNEKQTR
ncbi:hypothetical protein RH915_02600 [Serpentinicella sp. ANB-PHB4]|nr:hypothetical protein [Serpentinicella sp. ANB-PHB4]MDR5658371.1 hypothetical protein [Serpentinicella sp. ANB-PHB4]